MDNSDFNKRIKELTTKAALKAEQNEIVKLQASDSSCFCGKSKICTDKGTEFYNRSIKSWLQQNDTKIYSAHNKGKSAVDERFIRTLNT